RGRPAPCAGRKAWPSRCSRLAATSESAVASADRIPLQGVPEPSANETAPAYRRPLGDRMARSKSKHMRLIMRRRKQHNQRMKRRKADAKTQRAAAPARKPPARKAPAAPAPPAPAPAPAAAPAPAHAPGGEGRPGTAQVGLP